MRKANEEFLAQKKAHKLRGHRKRAGRRHKSEGHKKRERAGSAGSAAGLAFRSPRATRRKRSTKKRRRSGWSVSRKARNKKAHADNGNGLSANKLGLVIAAFLAPVVRKVQIEIEEIVETSSEAFQVVIAEGGEEVASFVETGFRIGKVVLAVLACWWVSRKMANAWVHMTNGNSMEPRLLSFDGTSSTWQVRGTKKDHRVRVSGNSSGCACRQYLASGTCDHVASAVAAHRKMVGAGSSSSAAARGIAAMGGSEDRPRKSMGLGLGSCFQGLVEKAKTLKGTEAPSQTNAIEDAQDFKRKVIKESLSLDSGRGSNVDEPTTALESGSVAIPRPKALKDKAESDEMDRCRVKFLRDAETFDWLVQVLESVGKGGRVLVRAYSFDQPDVINSLKQATERGCLTMVVADRSQAAGKTKTQLQMLKELRSSGVRVRLTEGLNVSQAYERDNRSVRLGRKLRGLQHGKSAYVQTDREDRRSPVQLVVGSCNLTTSSKANYEAGVALEISQESETAKKWLRAFEEIYEGGITIEDHEGAA